MKDLWPQISILLGFSPNRTCQTDIDGNDDDPKHGNPNADVEVRPPILNDKASSGEVVGKHDCILEEVVPPSGETIGLVSDGRSETDSRT